MSAATTTPPAPPNDPALPPQRRPGIQYEAIAIIAFVLALIAVMIATFGMGLAARSIDEHRATPQSGTSAPTEVALTEFSISPAPLTVSVGASLVVKNDGTAVHDLTIEDASIARPPLDAGVSEELSLGALDSGSYVIYCSIPGHRESGMEADLTISP